MIRVPPVLAGYIHAPCYPALCAALSAGGAEASPALADEASDLADFVASSRNARHVAAAERLRYSILLALEREGRAVQSAAGDALARQVEQLAAQLGAVVGELREVRAHLAELEGQLGDLRGQCQPRGRGGWDPLVPGPARSPWPEHEPGIAAETAWPATASGAAAPDHAHMPSPHLGSSPGFQVHMPARAEPQRSLNPRTSLGLEASSWDDDHESAPARPQSRSASQYPHTDDWPDLISLSPAPSLPAPSLAVSAGDDDPVDRGLRDAAPAQPLVTITDPAPPVAHYNPPPAVPLQRTRPENIDAIVRAIVLLVYAVGVAVLSSAKDA